MQTDEEYYLCAGKEPINHLLFACPFAKEVWSRILKWLNFAHEPKQCNEEQQWVMKSSKGKNARARVLKTVLLCVASKKQEEAWERCTQSGRMEVCV